MNNDDLNAININNKIIFIHTACIIIYLVRMKRENIILSQKSSENKLEPQSKILLLFIYDDIASHHFQNNVIIKVLSLDADPLLL